MMINNEGVSPRFFAIEYSVCTLNPTDAADNPPVLNSGGGRSLKKKKK
ncbi:hypothetical protein Si088_00477 [Streptococcus infantarius subsp. infantarius]|nr:hypothetical protein [Streptococcus infantarius subsp. infantarius]